MFHEVAKSFDRKECTGLMYKVNLQVGGLYFVTTNIDVSDGLFNGATGVLKAIEYGVKAGTTDEQIPTSAWLEFCHPSIGQEIRSNQWVKQRAERNKFPTSWTPIDRMSRVLNKTLHGMEVTRKQIPLQAANGMTVNKSQGSSLERVVACVGNKISRERLYVACSRATSLEGLYIVGQFKPPSFPGQSDPITIEMNELAQSPYIFNLYFPSPTEQGGIYFHNIEGILSHQADLLCDTSILSHDYLILVEPRIAPANNVNLNGYTTSFRKNSTLSRTIANSEGIVLLTNGNHQLSNEKLYLIFCVFYGCVTYISVFFRICRYPRKFGLSCSEDNRQSLLDFKWNNKKYLLPGFIQASQVFKTGLSTYFGKGT